MNLALEYIKYRWNCWKQSGNTNSSKVGIIQTCSNSEPSQADAKIIQKLLNRLKEDSRTIEVHDFGAGSKKLTQRRSIASILKTSSSKGKYGSLLYSLAKHTDSKHILELGTSIGIGSVYLKLGAPNARITSIEACPNTAKIASENFDDIGIEIELINETFVDYFKRTKNSQVTYDIVFVDGHHDGEALLNYMKDLESQLSNQAIVIVDDIRWSKSMKNAWMELSESQTFSVTIDLFRMGILAKEPTNKLPTFFFN